MQRITWVLLFMLWNCWAASTAATVKNQGQGIVRMHGSILETPCAIDMADKDQSVELGTETTGELLHDGRGPKRPFSIHLMNCNLATNNLINPTATRFQVTFEGKHDDSLFGLDGASGVGLQITDSEGYVSHPGEPMPAGNLLPGRMTLNYMLQLTEDHHRLRAGDYRTAIRFKIDYF